MAELPITYFLKEIVSNIIRQRNGQPFPWDDVGDDTGVIATTDADLIFQLSAFENSHTGGVVRIDDTRYNELKKNSNSTVYGARCAYRTQSLLRADQRQEWLVSDPAAVAVSAALGRNSFIQQSEEPVMKKAPEPVAAPVSAQVTEPAVPPISPAKVVRRGRNPKPTA